MIAVGIAFDSFTGSGNVIPFSFNLSDFCRSFRVESNTTIKIYIGHIVLLINEVHNVIKRNSSFEVQTNNCYRIIFRTQNRKNWKLHRDMRKDLGFLQFYIASCKRKSYSISQSLSTEFLLQAGIDENFHQWLGVRWQLEEKNCCC